MDWALEAAILQSLIGPVSAPFSYDGTYTQWECGETRVIYCVLHPKATGWLIIDGYEYILGPTPRSFQRILETLRDPTIRKRLNLPPLESP